MGDGFHVVGDAAGAVKVGMRMRLETGGDFDAFSVNGFLVDLHLRAFLSSAFGWVGRSLSIIILSCRSSHREDSAEGEGRSAKRRERIEAMLVFNGGAANQEQAVSRKNPAP